MAVNGKEYVAPTVPEGSTLAVIAGIVPTISVRFCVAVSPKLSLTVMEKLNGPAFGGVPVNAPFVFSSVVDVFAMASLRMVRALRVARDTEVRLRLFYCCTGDRPAPHS